MNLPKGEGRRHLNVPDPRPVQPEPEPAKLRLLAQEASLADALRALSRARRVESPFRRDIAALEALAADLSRRVLEEATR